MLYAKWYSHDCNAEECTETDMHKADFNASEDYPYDVHENRQTSHVSCVASYIPSKRAECESCHLQQLHAERNAYDCYTEYNAHDSIVGAYEKSAADNPDEVS